MRKNAKLKSDFRDFVFTATGRDTDLNKLSMIDVYDNVIAELDRLGAIVELLECANDSMEPEALGGVALLLKDIRSRMRAILEVAMRSTRTIDRARM